MGNCQKQSQQEQNPNPNNDHLGPVHQIRITNYSWNQDYQGLYDFDSKQVTRSVVKIQGNAILIKNNSNANGNSKYEIAEDSIPKLTQPQVKASQFRLIRKDDYYIVEPIFIENQVMGMGTGTGASISVQRLLWLVIASLPVARHQIQEKDVIKLGKQKIRVREIAHLDSNPSNINQPIKLTKTVYQNLAYQPLNKTLLNINPPNPQKSPKQSANPTPTLSQQTNTQQLCRICLDPGQHNNPLITPCKCSGSVKYIHLECLRSWLGKRLSIQKNQHCVTINWMPLCCEMCKSGFRYRIYMDGRKFYTVDIPKPPKPYIILELMRRTAGNKANGKIFHFVSFANKNKIMLGRRKDIDVRVSQDISISRAHACIQYLPQTKQFHLSDNKSKFGTLVLIKKGLLIRPQPHPHPKSISLQAGAQVYSFEAIRGPSRPNFVLNNGINGGGQTEHYLADNLSEDDEEEEEQQNDDQLDSGDEEEYGENPTNNSINVMSNQSSNVNSNGNVQGNSNVNGNGNGNGGGLGNSSGVQELG